jgi:FMN-dependent NADH-azoreductase
MKTLLQLNTSLFAENGNSTRLADRFVAAWRAQNPGGRVIVRDLADDPVPHLTAAHVMAFGTPADKRTPAQAAIVAASDALIADLKSADVVVLGLPMYNFGVPSQLKAYFDQLARAGVTFRYTDKGPQGLIGDKPVYIFAARGGLYAGTPRDTQTGYVSTFLNFIGLHELHFVFAEGLNMGAEAKAAALDKAEGEIDRIVDAQELEELEELAA